MIRSIAGGVLLYGRRQFSPPALVRGIALLLLPCLVPAGLAQVLLALLLMALPRLWSRR